MYSKLASGSPAVHTRRYHRDRERKPELYAQAGIPHYWRVERAADAAIVYTYELDPATHAYVATGIHRGGFKVEVPFPVEIDLGEIKRI